MADYRIILGNKNYSSWSLRAWLALSQSGASYEEVVVPLDRAETRGRILQYSPSGRVPVLDRDGLVIWDSLAIAEYLAETFPKAGLWPKDAAARAVARSIVAEMHSGFAALRRELPMDLRGGEPGRERSEACDRDIARILSLWDDCRGRFGGSGEFLFGGFSIADCFYAPVVTRFHSYDVPLADRSRSYCTAVMEWPAMREWTEAAREEEWVIENP